jgi:hypothetical protein
MCLHCGEAEIMIQDFIATAISEHLARPLRLQTGAASGPIGNSPTLTGRAAGRSRRAFRA